MKRLIGAVVIATTLVACVSAPGPRRTVAPDGVPSVTSPLALSPDGRTLWVVNPDAGSLTAVGGDALGLAFWVHDEGSADCCQFVGGPYVEDR